MELVEFVQGEPVKTRWKATSWLSYRSATCKDPTNEETAIAIEKIHPKDSLRTRKDQFPGEKGREKF